MTVDDIRALVITADPAASHYESTVTSGAAYTVWREMRQLGTVADDGHEEGWSFQIDRFTKTEGDTVAAAIRTALEGDPRVAYEYLVDYEPDTRYIHHIFDCEGI